MGEKTVNDELEYALECVERVADMLSLLQKASEWYDDPILMYETNVSGALCVLNRAAVYIECVRHEIEECHGCGSQDALRSNDV